MPKSLRLPPTILLAAPLCLAGLVAWVHALWLPVLLYETSQQGPAMRRFLAAQGAASLTEFAVWACALFGAIFVACGFVGFVHRPWALRWVRKGYLAFYVAASIYAMGLYQLTRVRLGGEMPGSAPATGADLFWALVGALAPVAFATLLFAALHVQSWRQRTLNFYRGDSAAHLADDGPGDLVIENLRRGGSDPRYRRSTTASLALHLFVIFMLPWLGQFGGCQWRYMVPKGGGEMQPVQVTVVQVRQEQQQRFVLNPESAIAMYVPDLDDSEVAEQVEQESRDTYEADTSRVLGQFGEGSGEKPGWPEGSEDAVFRFIRLQYDGRGWDDGMDAQSGADRNFLRAFNQLTKLDTADAGESIRIADLARYEKGYAPPFVYMTGDQGIRISNREVQILRAYLLDGGMLFADAGSAAWHRAFTQQLMPRLFPDRALNRLAKDDPIFNMPFRFPNGPPPLWHHGGYDCLGVRHQNRWAVFYHPGDVNDAWKTGHSGMNEQLAQGATELGVNIVHYAFSNYLRETRKHRQ